MSKIIVSTFVTLDGVYESPEDWSLNYFDEEAAKFANEQLFAADALLPGTIILSHKPAQNGIET